MSAVDPADVFRQEAAELLDNLEVTLLDLGQDAGNRNLVDGAFRAMHTLKGSGAMFGFDRLASFTHDFETAFDLVRQGKVAASQDLVQVALAARDHMQVLIDDPDAADAVIGRAILDNLQVLVDPGAPASPTTPANCCPCSNGSSARRTSSTIEEASWPDILNASSWPSSATSSAATATSPPCCGRS